jgi:hypothetical protein
MMHGHGNYLLMIVATLLAGSAWAQNAAGSGTITGTVAMSDGTPVSKATVSIAFRPTNAGEAPVRFLLFTTTAADGTFKATNVPNGKFAICPHASHTALLPPCQWGTEPVVTVSNGGTVSAGTITMSAGADLYVRVNDPNGVRAQNEGVVPGAGMLIAVTAAQGVAVPVPRTAVDSNGADYHLYVPTATKLTLLISSTAYSMTNSAKESVSKPGGYTLPFTIPVGTKQLEEQVSIQ